MQSRKLTLAFTLALLLTLTHQANAQSKLMRMADIHDDHIVFCFEDDLWRVSDQGGDARRLTNGPGYESWPKFSPDGNLIAFSAQYDGNTDVYIIPTAGGQPRRLTYHPGSDRVVNWHPEGYAVLFRARREYPNRGEELYSVAITGGMPQRMPVDRAGLAAISPDGRYLAYNRGSRESRTWKRHKGGTAQDIWFGSLERKNYHRLTEWEGSDNFPMWSADARAIFFNSDRKFGTLNLYRYDLQSGDITPLTEYKDYDVKYPSIGKDRIVYQYAEELHSLDTTSGDTRRVPVRIPTDLVRMRPELESVAPSSGTFRLSPTGKRLLLEVRGEIVNFPTDEGDPVNLTRTPGSREKNTAWSPDGRWIAFISDKTGEEEIYLVDQHGEQPWRQLTEGGLGFRMHLEWSPDSNWLIFSDKFMRLNLVDVDTGKITVIDTGEYDDAWERWGIQDYVWSPDSKWVAYTKFEKSGYEGIFLYSLDSAKSHRLTSEMTQDWSPAFDPDGKYLYFLSNRTFQPIMGFVDQNHIYLDMAKPYVVILQAGEPTPFVPEDIVEEVAADDDASGESAEKETEEADDDGVKIDIEGIERRIVAAPGVSPGNYFRLEATDKGFLYLHKTDPEFLKYQTVTDYTGGRLDLYHYNLEDEETKKLMSGINNYHLSADGKKMVYRAGNRYGVVSTGASGSVGDGKVDLGGIHIDVDRNQEFLQIFDEAWRVQRDWFYDPGMHGVDWEAMREKYRKFVPFCGNRSDLNYLIGEMIGELNIGHTYVWGGDLESDADRVNVGLLGARFAPAGNYYRVIRILPGESWDPSLRSPLAEPGCPIGVGDYIIAIDGEEITTEHNLYRALQGKAGDIVRITYNDEPSADGAKTHRLRPIHSESLLLEHAWVTANREQVDRASDAQIGYVHVPDMGERGLIEFAKVFYPHYYKKAFVIDARYNGGGFTGDMIIDRLERELWSLTKPREGGLLRGPERCFDGHLVVLINADTGSNGEMFAEAIKRKGLATVIGMRTWGGAIGIEPHQPLVDAGTVTPPQFGLFGLDRTWLIEGRGVEPDIEVENMPQEVLAGRDPQLEYALEFLQKQIEEDPKSYPAVPAYPDKSKSATGG